MWRLSVGELRQRPGRFAATFIAIALSVSFLVALSTMVHTEARAFAMRTTLPISQADLIVNASYSPNSEEVLERIRAVDGVTAAISAPQGTNNILDFDGRSTFVNLYDTPPKEFRWSSIEEGGFPERDGEIALSASLGKSLGLKLGDSVTAGQRAYKVVGFTDDARSLFDQVGYLPADSDRFAASASPWIIKADDDLDAVAGRILAVVRADEELADATVERVQDFRTKDVGAMVDSIATATSATYVFGLLALIIGAIIISNTFTILGAQRRRQVALLRAVGASPGQVLVKLVVEGLLVGIIGSLGGLLLGVLFAVLGAAVTGALHFGLAFSFTDCLWPFLGGVIVTLIAAVGPSVRASLVKPLEALQSVPTPRQRRAAGVGRIVISVVLLIGGVACFFGSRTETWGVVFGVGAMGFFSFTLLVAAPLYVAPLLRLGGALLGWAHPTVRLAFDNAARNPKRAASTAVALMLAVGVTVSFQTVLATVRDSGERFLREFYPADIQVIAPEGLPDELPAQLDQLGAVRDSVVIPTKEVELSLHGVEETVEVHARDNAFRVMGIDYMPAVPKGQFVGPGETLVVPLKDGGTATLKAAAHDWFGAVSYVVSDADFANIDAPERQSMLWIRMADRASRTDLSQIQQLLAPHQDLTVITDGAEIAMVLQSVLDVALIVLTVLLGVAVLIALVGVGNTLGLSVLERQRESALLRAVGMQPAGLRLMLLVEAMALTFVGVFVGIAGGVLFMWIEFTSIVASFGELGIEGIPLRFGVDVRATVILIGVCALAAALASVLPGRRAAKAAPAEALAVE
ncbi:FtsX-like permease family protein [uncultured Tessaracoccus sp.]|uniref:FtsX-like permease family protein n=1 Tax=uncultured Tessaracoccus sp. TaxID=905023 RepID=UPI002629282B|nr:ABC transporter permease [uncultured Tessaracoccus sp.]